MLERGKSAPDKHTFPFVLKACAYILTDTDSLLGCETWAWWRWICEQRAVPTDACNPRGIVNKGRQYFETMVRDNGIEFALQWSITVVSWTLWPVPATLPKLLRLVTSMPMKPDAVIWRSLLDACCKNGASVELSEEIATRLVERRECNQSFSGAYVLLSMHRLASGTIHVLVNLIFLVLVGLVLVGLLKDWAEVSGRYLESSSRQRPVARLAGRKQSKAEPITSSRVDEPNLFVVIISQYKQLAPTMGHGEVSSKKIKLESVLSSFDRSVVTRPFCRHSIVLSSLDRSVFTRSRSFSRSRLARSLAATRSPHLAQIVLSSVVTRSLCRHSIVLSSLDRSVVTRPFCRHSIVMSSLDRSVVVLAVARHGSLSRGYSSSIALSQSLGEDRSLAVPWSDLSRSLDSLFTVTRHG
ncbi:hypothetical protein F2Q68_00031489 [Brassica cretica]|uniref:Pentatricopeptide repeat-containing protein n=1 Tax=Brassica cretica TaxID=69181 RepID=A0A8S9GD61_BRACR|nr:hypothetical protein F2Q68_00031489 [Brassica cretica]